MLRKLLILGVCAGSSASVPILYQNNSEAVHGWLHAMAVRDAAPQPELTALSLTPQAEQIPPVGRKVAIPADARGHFLGDFKVNGRRMSAMIDTGATLVALNQSTARGLGIALAASEFRYKVETANGAARAAAVTIPALDIGRIHVTGVEAVVLQDDALQTSLVGMSFLKRLQKYEVENGAMLLVQ